MKAKLNNMIIRYSNRADALKRKRTQQTVSLSEAQELRLLEEFLMDLHRLKGE